MARGRRKRSLRSESSDKKVIIFNLRHFFVITYLRTFATSTTIEALVPFLKESRQFFRYVLCACGSCSQLEKKKKKSEPFTSK